MSLTLYETATWQLSPKSKTFGKGRNCDRLKVGGSRASREKCLCGKEKIEIWPEVRLKRRPNNKFLKLATNGHFNISIKI